MSAVPQMQDLAVDSEIDYTDQVEAILRDRDFKRVSEWTNPVDGAVRERYERGWGPSLSYAILLLDANKHVAQICVSELFGMNSQTVTQTAADFVAGIRRPALRLLDCTP